MRRTDLATFGAGCFWAVEEAFAHLDGVLDTRVGYMGGHTDAPSYDEVSSGDTGHVEVVQVEYDPDVVTYAELLAVFWSIHDPTSWDQQGPDQGSQYRSVIFTADDSQHALAEDSLDAIAAEHHEPVVTEIRPASTLWIAEDDHQRFLDRL